MADPMLPEQTVTAQALPPIDPAVAATTEARDEARQDLQSVVTGFDPSSETGPKPTFDEQLPQDHMQDLMKVAPIWMAFAALGGKFAHQSGLTMLTSTNAMMKGIVQGNSEQYAVARAKYDADYEAFKDKQKTWIDTYKAYAQAYKGRIDAAVQAFRGANTAVGIAESAAKNAENQARMMQLLPAQIALLNAKVRDTDADTVKKGVEAQALIERVQLAQRKAEDDERKTDVLIKNADTKALSGLAKNLHDQMDELVKQYKKGEIPLDVQTQIQSYNRQIDAVNRQLKLQFGTPKDVKLPPGAIAPAPPGATDGQTANGGAYIVKGGFVWPNR